MSYRWGPPRCWGLPRCFTKDAPRGASPRRPRLADLCRASCVLLQVSHLLAVGLRRLQKQSVLRGFQAWSFAWAEGRRRSRLVTTAARVLSRPFQARAFLGWQRDWRDAALRDALFESLGGVEELKEELAREIDARVASEAKVTQLHLEVRRIREVRLKEKEGAAQLQSLQRQHEEERTRLSIEQQEVTVAHLQRMGVRRLQHRFLSLGWTLWKDEYLARRRQQQLVQRTRSQLSRPGLFHVYAWWRDDWRETARVDEAMALKAALDRQTEERLALQKELERMRAATDAQLASEWVARTSEMGQLKLSHAAELNAKVTASRQAAKEATVAHLQSVAVRRLGLQLLSKGFGAWQGRYLERRHRARRLHRASTQLQKPNLLHLFTWWYRDWSRDMHRLALEQSAGEAGNASEQLERQLREAHDELREERRLRLEEGEARRLEHAAELEVQSKVAARQLKETVESCQKALAEARSKQRSHESAARNVESASQAREAELQRALEERVAAEREATIAHLHQAAARRLSCQYLSRGFETWREAWEGEAHKARLLQRAASQLARPGLLRAYTFWRAEWEQAVLHGEAMELRAELERQAAANAALEAQLEQVRAEADGVIAAASSDATARQAQAVRIAKRVASEGADLIAVELALERTALADERRALTTLKLELDELRGQPSLLEDLEDARGRRAAAEEAKAVAEAEAARLVAAEAETKRVAEQRLASLLAEQRATLDASVEEILSARDARIDALRGEKRKLEQRVADLEAEFKHAAPSRQEFKQAAPSRLGGAAPLPRKRAASHDAASKWAVIREERIAPAKFFKPFKLSSETRADRRKKAAEEAALELASKRDGESFSRRASTDGSAGGGSPPSRRESSSSSPAGGSPKLQASSPPGGSATLDHALVLERG